MEIRKPGAAELKPALALAWDVFLKDAASGFSDEGIRTFKRFIEYDSMAATLANGTTTMWAAFSGLEPIGVIAARESHICLFFVAGPHQRHGIGRRLFETFRSRRPRRRSRSTPPLQRSGRTSGSASSARAESRLPAASGSYR